MGSYRDDKEIAVGTNDTPAEQEKKILLGLERYPESKAHFLRELVIHYAFRMNKPGKALLYCHRILDECTGKDDLVNAWYYLSDYYADEGESSLAISYLEKALELDANDTEAVTKIANIYIEQELYDKAAETYKRLLSMSDYDGKICDEEYYEAMAALYEEMEEPEKALECREYLLSKSTNDKSSAARHQEMAEEYTRCGKTEQAREHFQKAIDHYLAALDKTGIGIEEIKNDQGTTLVNHDTNRFRLLETIAYTWQLAGNQVQSAQWYHKTIEAIEAWLLLKGDKANLEYYKSHLPQLYYIVGDNKKAIALYQQLLAAPSRAQETEYYYRGMAEAYKDENNFDKACECWQKILDKYSESGEALLNLAYIYYEQQKFDIAKPYFERHIELYPDENARAYASLAFCFNQREEPQAVLSYLQKAIKVNGNDDKELASAIYAAMGKIYWHQLKDASGAIDSFRKMMAHKPSPENISDAGATILVLSFTAEGNELAMQFWADYPVQGPDAPKGDRLTQQQIRALPYYHGKIPKDTGDMLRWKKQTAKDFETDLQNNPLYKDYFSKYDEESVRHFIHMYARHKELLVSYGETYMKEKEERYEEYLVKDANNIFDLILQKKLFNMQLLWRAEQLTIPQVQICYDFKVWSRTKHGSYTECPFIDEVTAEEVEVMKQFLADDNFSDSTKYWLHTWQDYTEFTERNAEDHMEFMPDWYEFYDGRMGTGALLTLPDLRGKKEAYYTSIYRDWIRKQPKEPVQPATAEMSTYKRDIFPVNETYTAFMKSFENNYLNLLHKRFLEGFECPDKLYPEEAVREAILDLEQATVPVYIEGGMPWYEAIILAAQKYKNNLIAEKLDEVYHDYLNRRELLRDIPVSGTTGDDADDSGYHSNRKMFAEQILKGRELNGEPRDFNY